VDAVFVMAAVGDKVVLDLMQAGKYRLLSIDGWNEGNATLKEHNRAVRRYQLRRR
jgi:hypothetical protein